MNIRIKKSRDADKSKITYYENLIKNNPEREFIEVFSNRGISGTKGKRPGFQRMFKVCRDGEIDLIITKSISRFARNTLDCLKLC